MGGMGGGQGATDAPVVDTAEQVRKRKAFCLNRFNFDFLGLHFLPRTSQNVETRQSRSAHGGDGSDAGRVCG